MKRKKYLKKLTPLSKKGICGWSAIDVLSQAKEMGLNLNSQEANDILELIERKADASQGISWITLEFWIMEYKNKVSL